ncbi:ethanolamine ammonia-lyase subunit EutC [Aurantimonas endophytica]|uniref:Ethanolamine ammonia-lyase small subunit n=1 Tax=Aurantimonas endophytica TaxID=1522175 RepID=A0A7W6MPG5_9HYPH|nr:ethanolamine ammonia-lyase small subunit [Aurantimonas endophytica]MCO6403805.1 ethanolamine ammonia-lyase subunit EutC [Aurantimonas endophytica]
MSDELEPGQGAPHPLARLRRHTDARIALGRFGAGLPTAAHLDFAEAHAAARDAVHAEFDVAGVEAALAASGHPTLRVASQAPDRTTYLRRPDLGRLMAPEPAALLRQAPGPHDLVLIVADGLSAFAANSYGATVAAGILDRLPDDWAVAPVVIASHARVALSDPIGEALGARIALMLVGERPGLSAADSLGAYLTFGPRPGRSDADRNCVSNIRDRGFTPAAAVEKLVDLLRRSHALGLSGVGLKDDGDDRLTDAAKTANLLPG